MTKTEQVRLVAWRSKILQHASGENRTVCQTCRFFGISRKTYYKWANRHRTHGDAGLCDRARVALRFPRATPPEVVSKILYLRQQYHFGAGRIADYLQRFHHISVARSTVAPAAGQARCRAVAGQSEASATGAALAAV
jgi:transposase